MGQPPSGRMRLGKIGFLNVLPIYYPLESGIVSHPFKIISGIPAYLNGLMAAGGLDLSVVSSIEYAYHPERYFILPDLSISCCGPVQSVLLLSRVPIDRLEGETVFVSTQSHTSVALLKVLFSIHLGIRADFEPADCSEALTRGRHPTAFLAIGDEALRLRVHDDYPFRWDLGEVWREWTDHPFVFALWVVQRKAVQVWNGRLRNAIEALSAAKEWGNTHRAEICEEALQRNILGWEELHSYYQGLAYDLSRAEQKGLRLFYRYLVEIGEISKMPRLEIYSPLADVA